MPAAIGLVLRPTTGSVRGAAVRFFCWVVALLVPSVAVRFSFMLLGGRHSVVAQLARGCPRLCSRASIDRARIMGGGCLAHSSQETVNSVL